MINRAILVASAIFLAAGMNSAALAGCGGCGFEPAGPGAYDQPFYGEPAYAPPPLAMPAPVPPPVEVAPAPIAVDHWDTGGFGGCGGAFGGCGGGFGGCGGGFGGCGGGLLGFNGCNCGHSGGYYPSPLYVVNQGPEYSGPGLMLPYGTYAPAAAYAPGINYPYIGPRYGYGARSFYRYGAYRGARLAYGARVYAHPHYYGGRARLYR